ncbi:MAG: replication initiation protein RepC [Boseongicola sp.]|nr:replication initiation protein RepC [Boseongicola sp.]
MHAPVESGAYDPERWMDVQAFVPQPNHHSRLPDRVSKPQAMTTICSALRLLGATEREIAVWRHVADITERQAWHAEDRSPVNWKRQCDMAREMDIGERQFRRIEARLAGFGVLARTTADNGYRGRRSGQAYGAPIGCGLSIEPALANFRAFAGIVEEAALAEEARQEKALEARTARRRVGLLVATLKDIEMRHWAKGRLDELDVTVRPPCPRVAEFDELALWIAALVELEAAIREALAPCPIQEPEASSSSQPSETSPDDAEIARSGIAGNPGSVENVGNQRDMSGAPDIEVRSHIQPESTWKCIQDENGEAAGSPPAHRRPKRQERTAGMTLEDLRNLASDDMALWLDTLGDWQDALPHVLRELGINVNAWHDACEAMGPPLAFLALVVIDRNRFHPKTPVLNPGGALRAFTARARAGGLDLARSVAGIRDRERKGLQPKGPERPPRPS